MSTIVDFWRNVTFSSEENVILEDKEAMADLGERFTLQGMPEPFIGNVENAKIYLLSLNPGAIGKEELDSKELQELTKKNLLQENTKCQFFYLANEIKTMDGAKWWRKRLVEPLTDATKKSEKEVIKAINDNICNLEIIPYHSKDSKNFGNSVYTLYSAKAMRSFVKNYVCKRDDNPLIIVMRAKKEWMPCFDDYILEGKSNLYFRKTGRTYTMNSYIEGSDSDKKVLDLIAEKLFE